MTRCGWIIALLTSLLLVTAVEAGPKGNNGNSATLDCPPGLAKKNPPCVPPGQAKKGVTARIIGQDVPFDPYGIGDRLPDGYVTVIDPRLFAPNDNAYYVRSGDSLYRIDGETGLILDLIGNLFDLLG